jgi:hypothetical protein
MFATLLGPLPRPPLGEDVAPEALLDTCLELQAEHGLEPATDGGWPITEDPVASWRETARRADLLVKAVVVGPYTSGRGDAATRAAVDGLADAGCRWIEIHEPAAVSIGRNPEARARFVDAHVAMTRDASPDVHLSLAITGGDADAAGVETILAGSYASLAVDLIDGPDNWRLAVGVPGERGVICGALSARAGSDDGPEVLLWAARYAAASKGRGIARVGLATSGSMADLTWDEAVDKVRRLGDAARLVVASPEERRQALDPRAVDIRSAALGRVEPVKKQRPSPTDSKDDPG